ncbi:Rieske (2Fe-2S) protein [Desulfitibacter alkalitolerans]|uniref:Rieske (2Fe-2S) protein n=1 Tax=Desulfitibacter alkalitolerans TaxID=264641 RepID=UPI0004811FB9|nr:Rieske (2Fe-2S) protein [Desulfitibacter alkalitolerans]
MWVKVAEESLLQEKVPYRVKVEDKPIIVIKMGEELYALLNLCPHLGCAMHKGELEGYLIKCPCHDWLFDIRTGEFTAAPEIRLPIYETKVEQGIVYINIKGE